MRQVIRTSATAKPALPRKTAKMVSIQVLESALTERRQRYILATTRGVYRLPVHCRPAFEHIMTESVLHF